MKYILIDKIVACDEGESIQSVKGVSLAEEYLQDHFPTFPVLPGVLLLQGLVETAAWLVRISQAFSHSMVLLEKARNVKYKSFLAPGMQITYDVQVRNLEDRSSRFQGVGTVDGKPIVEARFDLRHFSLAEQDPSLATRDTDIITQLKKRLELLK